MQVANIDKKYRYFVQIDLTKYRYIDKCICEILLLLKTAPSVIQFFKSIL